MTFDIVTRCGICNTPIQDDEDWTETDCVICEACSNYAKYLAESGEVQNNYD